MNIKDKLARLDKTTAGQKIPDFKDDPQLDWIEDFQTELNAKVISEKNSFIILKENIFPLYQHTDIDFLRSQSFHFTKFRRLTGKPDADPLNLRSCVFVDLETTGLAGGAGTFAFLIGIGHIELDYIVVRQYVLPDFQHEWLALKLLNNLFLSFDSIVSFNGKTYDIPLLKNRFILNKMDSPLEDLEHFDVLHLARRVWKRRVKACDLQNLEYVILNQQRVNDIPGALIPHIYFEFIRKRKVLLLRDVLEHNYYDIVNLVLLTIKIGKILNDPLAELSYPEDIFSLAQYFNRTHFQEEAKRLYTYLTKFEPDSLIGKEANFWLAMLYKKNGDFENTGKLMRKLLQTQKDHPGAIVELAKYYEHRAKDLTAALKIVDQAIHYIELLDRLGKKTPLTAIESELKYRQKRLLRKIKRLV